MLHCARTCSRDRLGQEGGKIALACGADSRIARKGIREMAYGEQLHGTTAMLVL